MIFSCLTLIERNYKGLVIKEAARTCVTLWTDGPMSSMTTHGDDFSDPRMERVWRPLKVSLLQSARRYLQP